MVIKAVSLSFAALLLLVTAMPSSEADAPRGQKRSLGKKDGGKKGGKKGKKGDLDEDVPKDLPNVLWILIDDVSTERYPDSGNSALDGLLPGLEELKADGAVYYPHFYSPSSLCAPSQVALFSGMDPANIGGHYQFANDVIEGKEDYFCVPPKEVQFLPEKLRSLGYYATGAGKLDYQVGEVMPTFYNAILSGGFSNINAIMEQAWQPAIDLGRPFYSMLNMMDNHQFVSTASREVPIPITDSLTGLPPMDLPFAQFGYTPPNGLLYPGPNGQPVPGVTASQDLLATEILGYRGSYDENSLTYENGGIPGYMPNDIGVKSLLAREYDLIRNIDYRVSTVIRRLKERGVYNNTMIALFGDHGSGNYRSKGLMQPQSIRTPLWIKYPDEMPLPSAVEINDEGTYEDDRMTGITDLYPTTLSVIGVPPESYHAGRAVAGEYEDTSAERDIMYALITRVSSFQGYKSFAAFTKEYFYQRHLLNEDAIDAREAIGEDPSVIADARKDALLDKVYDLFPAAPLFDRIRKLLLVNAEDPAYPDKFKFLAANDARPPPEAFFDLTMDPDTVDNLIVDYTYTVGLSNEEQKWGNKVANVTVSYGPVNEYGLSAAQGGALEKLRNGLDSWIGTQKYVTGELDWSESLWGEENKMAREFWPDGVQPDTSTVSVNPSNGKLSSETPGAVFRYTIVTPEERGSCERIGSSIKADNPILTPFNSDFDVVDYTSVRYGGTYSGFLWRPDFGREVVFQNFVGEERDCLMFLSEDVTFLELSCRNLPPFTVDSRDATWDGTAWEGVDEATGEWLGEPLQLFDMETNTWNLKAFNFYMYGPLRNQVYSGLNPDGTPFVAAVDRDRPANIGYNPAPKYWGTDVDPFLVPSRFKPSETIILQGYSVIPSGTFYRAEATPGLDDKGSWAFQFALRTFAPPNLRPGTFSFDSFDYECLLWEVGTQVELSDKTGTYHVFTQGVRKGFSDSAISETILEL